MRLSDHTTLKLGGPAKRFVHARTRDELVRAVADADTHQEPVLVLGGGSNLVVSDDGFDGVVVLVDTRGIQDQQDHLTVAAGEIWDDFVATCVSRGLSGVECLAGIPGRVGATPMQNVGAYGQEVKDTVTRVHVWDRTRKVETVLSREECKFSYRSSMLKHEGDRFLVLDVEFSLEKNMQSAPIRYAELARALSVVEGDTADLSRVRETVIALRRLKGMVSDSTDRDSQSVGSFFMNPTLTPAELGSLDARVTERLGANAHAPRFPSDRGLTKVAAAWLIEQAGFHKGYGDGQVGISEKHALALINRGGGTTKELVALARTIRDGVRAAFGVNLFAEPKLVGCSLDG